MNQTDWLWTGLLWTCGTALFGWVAFKAGSTLGYRQGYRDGNRHSRRRQGSSGYGIFGGAQ